MEEEKGKEMGRKKGKGERGRLLGEGGGEEFEEDTHRHNIIPESSVKFEFYCCKEAGRTPPGGMLVVL